MIYLLILIFGVLTCFLKPRNRLFAGNNFVLGFSLTTYILSEALSIGGFFSIDILRFISLGCFVYFSFRLWTQRERAWLILTSITKTPTLIQIYVLIMLLGIGASALLYTPNNWDSNTYHLPRIIIWLQNKNIYHYPTHIFRQIYQPILSEVQLTWVYATFGPVNILNLQQFFYFIFSMIVGYIILKRLFVNNKVKFTDVAIALLSVSSAVLEASNTKNDIIVTYFILNYIYCWVVLMKDGRVNVFGFVSSIALAVLTKGTSYIFITSITIGFLIIFVLNKNLIKSLFIKKNIKALLLSAILIIVILFPFVYRNISLSGNIYCQDQKEKFFYQNEIINTKSIVSNAVKNISVQLCPPFNILPVYQTVEKIHRYFNLPSVDDPELNFGGFKFSIPEMKIKNYFEEDSVPNFLLFFTSILVFFSAFFIYKKNGFTIWAGGLFVFLLTIIIFSALLKWQIWHTRLLIPAFIILSLSNLFVIKNMPYYRAWIHLTVLISFWGIVFNNQRPVIPFGKYTRTFNEGALNRTFYNSLPNNKNVIYKYREFNQWLEVGGLNIGFICKNDAGVFPYMWNNRKWKNKYFFVGNINNLSRNITQQIPALDYIILDGKLINDHLNNSLIKNYQLIDMSSFGILLFKKNLQ